MPTAGADPRISWVCELQSIRNGGVMDKLEKITRSIFGDISVLIPEGRELLLATVSKALKDSGIDLEDSPTD